MSAPKLLDLFCRIGGQLMALIETQRELAAVAA